MTVMIPIRVLLVDDHTMVRRGLATFLRVYDDLQLVGEAADGETAVQLCASFLPDVVLMDWLSQKWMGLLPHALSAKAFRPCR